MGKIVFDLILKVFKNNPQLIEDVLIETVRWITAEIKKANENSARLTAEVNKVNQVNK